MITYREARFISTDDQETIKIELEYLLKSNEPNSHLSSINRIQNLLDELEKDIRRTPRIFIEEIHDKPLNPFQRIYNKLVYRR